MSPSMTNNCDNDNDGGGAWDDDVDLLAMLDDDDDDAVDSGTSKMASRVREGTAAVDAACQDDVTAVPYNATFSQVVVAETETADNVNYGWDDDDDLDLDLNANENENYNSSSHHHDDVDGDKVVTELQVPTSIPPIRAITTNNNTSTLKINNSTAEEWDFDEDEDIFNENNLELGDEEVHEYSKRDSLQEVSGIPPLPTSAAATDVSDNHHSWHGNDSENGKQQQQQQQQLYEEKPIPSSDGNENSITGENGNRFISTNDDNVASSVAGWSDDEYCFDDNDGEKVNDDDEKEEEEDNDLNLTTSSAPLPSFMIPPPPHPKPLPPSPFPSVQSPPVAHRTRAKFSQLTQSEQKSAFVVEEVAEDIQSTNGIVPLSPSLLFNPAQRRNHRMLSRYMSSLHDSNFLTRLHQKLHLYQQQHQPLQMETSGGGGGGGGGGGSTAASDLRAYYAARPGLRKYTLGVELDRMEYTLVLSNGKLVCDNDVIRSYFGVDEDGETIGGGNGSEGGSDEDVITTEELLIRSANQSLLADLLVALTGAEDDLLTKLANVVGGEEDNCNGFLQRVESPTQDTERFSPVLILSGPLLCMTSVAESCQFKVDIQCGFVEALCSLAISIPYHEHSNNGDDPTSAADDYTDTTQIENGRLVLARSMVSVRFRPGGEGGDSNDEPTVQYAVQSISPLLKPDSALLKKASLSLAYDEDDPFVHNEFADINSNDGAADARDLFLLSHHLADSGLLIVSDHIDRLRDAATAKSTGFRSALRQLDGVTNVSSKLQGLGRFGLALPSAEEIEAAEQEAAGAVRHLPRPPPPPVTSVSSKLQGLGRFGLALPSAEEIEAAEQEAAGAVRHLPRPPPPPPGAEFRFRLSGNVAGGDSSLMHNVRSTDNMSILPPPPPPHRPPPPPMPPQTETSNRPRPILGGLLMSGLSRLAAAATQPDDQQDSHSHWEGAARGGTGLTPLSSPQENGNDQTRSVSKDIPRLHRHADEEFIMSDERGGNSMGSSPSVLHPLPRHKVNEAAHLALVSTFPSSQKNVVNDQGDGRIDDGNDDEAGWSDEEFDFEDGGDNGNGSGDDNEQELSANPATTQSGTCCAPHNDNIMDGVRKQCMFTDVVDKPTPIGVYDGFPISVHDSHRHDHGEIKRAALEPSLSSSSFEQQRSNSTKFHHSRTFEEEFVMVLKEKIDAECQEMREQGRMKRWAPISEDPILRQQLMEVMVAQIQS